MVNLIKRGVFLVCLACGLMVPMSGAWAHGGAAVEFDTCRIPIGSHWVHFTGYTPQLTADIEYCNDIPDLGLTNLVFDYEGKPLRNMTVEFEVTKEPEGSVVYHLDAAPHPTGTILVTLDFRQLGAGKYLNHVTLINGAERIDAHVPMTVGEGGSAKGSQTTAIIAVVAVGALVALYFLVPAFRQKVDGMLAGKQSNKTA